MKKKEIDYRKPQQEPAFDQPGAYIAWVVGSCEGVTGERRSKCAILVQPVDDSVQPIKLKFESARTGSTQYRAVVEALRGAIEAVPEGSSLTVYSCDLPMVNAFNKTTSRKAHLDLWALVDRALESRNLEEIHVKWRSIDKHPDAYNHLHEMIGSTTSQKARRTTRKKPRKSKPGGFGVVEGGFVGYPKYQ